MVVGGGQGGPWFDRGTSRSAHFQKHIEPSGMPSMLHLLSLRGAHTFKLLRVINSRCYSP